MVRPRNIITFFLICMLCVSQCSFARAESTGTTNNTSENSNIENSNVHIADYLSSYKEVAQTNYPITLDAKSVDLSSNATRKASLDGVSDVVDISNGGSIEWHFHADQTALYTLKILYYNLPGNSDFLLSFYLDGKMPYQEANNISLKRVWKDVGTIKTNPIGNDVNPSQVEVNEWISSYIRDFGGFHTAPLQLYLPQGDHVLKLSNLREPIAVKNVELTDTPSVKSNAEAQSEYQKAGYSNTKGILIKQEAETPYQKSNATYAEWEKNDPAVEPNDPVKIKDNVLYSEDLGIWVSYKINVPQSGLYQISIKYLQNAQIGVSTLRDVYVDGVIPNACFTSVEFPYTTKWKMKTISDSNGKPSLVYLSKGTHEIRFENTLGKWSEVLEQVEKINEDLSSLYREIIMITGTNPDSQRDYYLDREIPGLMAAFKSDASLLNKAANRYDVLNGSQSVQSATLRNVAREINDMIKNPDTIPSRLGTFRSNISSLSDWISDNKDQYVEMDYFIVSSPGEALPAVTANFFEKMKFNFLRFIGSFYEDYNSISVQKNSKHTVRVWVGLGREQADIIENLISDKFTPSTGISVNLSLTSGGYIESKLAGQNPDVIINVSKTWPVNMAMRGALTDLSQFSTFKQVKSRFASNAFVPYQYNGGVYALPMTQTFLMMYYRTDIFRELNLTPPKTWDDFRKIIPVLERNNMTIALPYQAITTAGAYDTGLGIKDIFATLLMQNGCTVYNKSLTQSMLDQPKAIDAFQRWTDFYSKYGLLLTVDMSSRFRTGEVPLGINTLDFYTMLSATAPEIRNEWAMVPTPGTRQADGSINNTIGAGGTSCVMYDNAQNKEDSWKFLDWWTSNDIQYQYGIQVEQRLGVANRYMAANLQAFNRLPWTSAELSVIQDQRSRIQEIPEIPGDYLIYRCIDNAFREVVYDNKNPKDAIESQNQNINDEITRKRIEFGLAK